MKRHKLLFRFNDWSGEFFDYLKNNNMITEEYEYSTKDNYCSGKVYEAKEYGKTFPAIASNVLRTYSSGKGRWRRVRKYRIMYALTEKGYAYICSQVYKSAVAN